VNKDEEGNKSRREFSKFVIDTFYAQQFVDVGRNFPLTQEFSILFSSSDSRNEIRSNEVPQRRMNQFNRFAIESWEREANNGEKNQ
jgi:hypothetical protein